MHTCMSRVSTSRAREPAGGDAKLLDQDVKTLGSLRTAITTNDIDHVCAVALRFFYPSQHIALEPNSEHKAEDLIAHMTLFQKRMLEKDCGVVLSTVQTANLGKGAGEHIKAARCISSSQD